MHGSNTIIHVRFSHENGRILTHKGQFTLHRQTSSTMNNHQITSIAENQCQHWSDKTHWHVLASAMWNVLKCVYLHWIYTRDAQTQSWRAGVLQSLAPTCLNTPAWKFLVCLIRAWLAASGVFNRHCRTPALQDRVWAPLIYSNITWKILPIFSVVLPSS